MLLPLACLCLSTCRNILSTAVKFKQIIDIAEDLCILAFTKKSLPWYTLNLYVLCLICNFSDVVLMFSLTLGFVALCLTHLTAIMNWNLKLVTLYMCIKNERMVGIKERYSGLVKLASFLLVLWKDFN